MSFYEDKCECGHSFKYHDDGADCRYPDDCGCVGFVDKEQDEETDPKFV